MAVYNSKKQTMEIINFDGIKKLNKKNLFSNVTHIVYVFSPLLYPLKSILCEKSIQTPVFHY